MSAAILNGFSDPVQQSQQVYRGLLDAMSRPATIVELDTGIDAPSPLSQAAAASCLTLLDFETTVWLAPEAWPARDFLVFHCHCPFSEDRGKAEFAILPKGATLPAFEAFQIGTHEHPETSTTLILEVDGLGADKGLKLTGPGINRKSYLRVDGAPDHLWEEISRNQARFPVGVDLILTCGSQLAAIPRTTHVEI